MEEKSRIYYHDNKEQRNKKRSEKYYTDIYYRLKTNVSSVIRGNINKNGKSIEKYLPYTIEELKQHLQSLFEPWMTWKNWGRYNKNTWNDNDQLTWTWQIDHIIPQSEFYYISVEDEEFKKCWGLENLRPLSAKQNIIDGSTKIRHNATG